jgi:polysaccharide biosynthesis transport protein
MSEPEGRGTRRERDLLVALMADVRDYRWVAVVVLLLALGGAVAATVLSPTTYTGRASLIVSSNDRSPDQDAVLVQGYVDYFDDTAYQAQILDLAGVEGDVTIEARSAASSPIMIIEATADDPDVAADASSAVAQAFRDSINAVRLEDKQAQMDQLQSRLDARRRADGAESGGVATLRAELLRVEADRTDELQDLQLDGGVSENAADPVTNLGLGLVGGLVLGVCAAAATGALARRRRSRG